MDKVVVLEVVARADLLTAGLRALARIDRYVRMWDASRNALSSNE